MHKPVPVPVALSLLALLWAPAAIARADSLEPNDSPAQASGPLLPAVPVQSWIGYEDDLDWYAVDADTGALAVNLTGIPAGTDYDLYLTDGNQNILAYSDSLGTVDEGLTLAVPRGRYYVEVRSSAGSSDVDPYTLTAVFTPIVNAPPMVAILAPAGGDTLVAGAVDSVRWTAADPEDGDAVTVDLAWSAGDGASWDRIAGGLPGSGSYGWTVPAAAVGGARIRVTATDSADSSASASCGALMVLPATGTLAFSLSGPGAVTGGDTLAVAVGMDNSLATGAVSFDVSYDATRLIMLGSDLSGRGGPAGLDTISTPGRLGASVHWDGPLAAGSGDLMVLRFRARYLASGPDTLRISGSARDVYGRDLAPAGGALAVALSPLQPSLTLSVTGSFTVAAGGTLTVPVNFASDVEVGALDFVLQYDPSQLVRLGVMPGNRAPGVGMQADLTVPGRIGLEFDGADLASIPPGSGLLTRVDFLVLAAAAHGSLTLSEARALADDGTEFPVTVAGSTFTPVEDAGLTAADAADGVRLTWRDASDLDVLGYRVLRDDDSGPRPLTLATLDPGATQYTDGTAVPGVPYSYWLERLTRDGEADRFGPVAITVAARPLSAGLPYPNPTQGAVRLDVRPSGPGDIAATVIDLNGRVVRSGSLPAGAGAFQWDGRTASGAEAPAGIYFVHLRQGQNSVVRRVVRLGR